MLVRDNITVQSPAKTTILDKEAFRDEIIKKIRLKVDGIEAILTRPYEYPEGTTLAAALPELFELLDGLMANEGIAPDEIYRKQRTERDKMGGFRLRRALAKERS